MASALQEIGWNEQQRDKYADSADRFDDAAAETSDDLAVGVTIGDAVYAIERGIDPVLARRITDRLDDGMLTPPLAPNPIAPP